MVNILALSDEEAVRGVQIFFETGAGAIDATFAVGYTGSGTPEGRNLLFGGDSALCNPPPPAPLPMPDAP